MELRAHGDLVVDVAADTTVRIGRGDTPDWFGAGRPTGVGAGAASVTTPGGETATSDPAPLGGLTAPHGLTSTVVTDDMGVYTGVVVTDGDIRRSVRAYAEFPMVVFSTRANVDLDGVSTGSYDQPSVGWPVFTPSDRVDAGVSDDLRAVVFQHCEFGLPSTSGAALDGFFLLPHRPPTGWPLIVESPGIGALLVAPIDNFHDQVVGLNGGTVRCGWNGDMNSVPRGFSTDLAVIAGDGPRECIDMWADLLLRRAGTVRPGRWADALASRPSYWTDNGAAYWYRTEPGYDVAGSIVAAVDDLRSGGVPVGAVQLDSWFYPHVDLRPFDTDEWVVPPSALTAWEERPDVLPDGIRALRARLGDPPLVAHIRHLSAKADIAAELPVYVDGDHAVPATPEIYERWLDQCVAWGVETFEHDWLVEVFFGVRGLRERPGRAREWQEGIDRAARERGITLQWCMATPADLAQTTSLTQVTSVRTCGDHGYIATAGQLWAWFATTNALARSLGLMPFKDVFRADPDVAGENGEPEALLSALSTGPVGLGDRVGRMDPELAMRTCRADGLLIKPDVPIAAIDASMLGAPAFAPELLVAECYTDHRAGRWTYALGMHANPGEDEVTGEIVLADLGAGAPTGDVAIWDWRSGTVTIAGPEARLPVTLAKEDWAYFVVAPILADGRLAVIGDVSKFVTAGDARIEVDAVGAGSAGGGGVGSDRSGDTRSTSVRSGDTRSTSVQSGSDWSAANRSTTARITIKGAGETVTVTGWSTGPVTVTQQSVTRHGDGSTATAITPTPDRGAQGVGPVTWDDTTGVWTMTLQIGSRGWESVLVSV